MPLNIGVIGIQCVVDSLCRIQAHVTLGVVIRGVNGSHVNGGMPPCRISTACYGDIAARLHVQRAGCFDAQRHIRRNHEFRQVAIFPNGFDVGSVHIHEFLHVLNLICSGQVVHFNFCSLVGNRTYSPGRSQRNIIAQHIGCPFRLRAFAACFVHQRVADGVEHHVLRPFKGRIRCLSIQILIGSIMLQIIIGIGVLGIFIGSGIFQISVRRGIIGVLGILLCCLNVSIIIGVPISIRFTIICICDLLSCLLGKCVVLRLFAQVIVIIGRIIDCSYRSLLISVFCLPLGLCFARISRFYVRLIVVAVLFQPRDVRALVGVVPLRVLFAVNQPGIDPAMHHFVHAIHRTGIRVTRKRVDEAAIHNGQRHIPFF